MRKSIKLHPFLQSLFDDPSTASKAAEIGEAILSARSLRLTEIAAKMRGSSAASYKRIQRFLHQADPRQALWRLFQEQAEFVIGDPNEIERPQAYRTETVGTLKDGKTKGFWALVLGTAYRGRAIPCGLITYSSQTIAQGLDSRNLNHLRAFAELKGLLGERPLVLDREFSYLELLKFLVTEPVNFVIRLNLRSRPPKFWDSDGREVGLTLSRGGNVIHRHVWYKGKVCVNLVGIWDKGFADPLWILTNLPAKEGLRIYQKRMKLEESFRDRKSFFGMDKLMNKRQESMEKMLALLLLVYAIGLLIGEGLRDWLYGEPIREQEITPQDERIPDDAQRKKGRKWKCYSGLFILIMQKWSLSTSEWHRIICNALAAFITIVPPPVLTYV
ncbi:MAG: transposase [candidate division WOR-3 bacterium]